MINDDIKKIIFLLIIFVFSLPQTAQSQSRDLAEHELDILGELRPRFELRDGVYRPLAKGEKPAALISDRTRLQIDYAYKDVFSIRIAPQSVSIWGQAGMVQGLNSPANNLSLFESWVRINFSSKWDMKIGRQRQKINLTDEELYGKFNWGQGGRAHDGISFNYSRKGYEFKALFSYNQNYSKLYNNNLNNASGSIYSNPDALGHKWMQTLWGAIPVGNYSKLVWLFTNLGLQDGTPEVPDASVNHTQISGIKYLFDSNRYNLKLAGYYQSGKEASGLKNQAYLLSFNAGKRFGDQWKVEIGSDYLSGNDMDKPLTKNKAFKPYFYTGHRYYGEMEYFYIGKNPHEYVGLSDNYLKLDYFFKDYRLSIGVHQFVSPTSIYENGEKLSNNLGQEVDFSFLYRMNKFINVTGGYSFYLTTDGLNAIKGVPDAKNFQQWGWLSIIVTPRFVNLNL